MTRTVRVHTTQPLTAGGRVALEPGPARHLVRVLRRRPGDRICLFDGSGSEHDARIVETGSSERCVVEVGPARHPPVESPLSITLIQAIGRGDRMDWCIQKACELGVASIVPVMTERTEVRLSGRRAEKRLRHWQKVAISACEQSGRTRIPEITAPEQLTAIRPEVSARFFLDPEAGLSLARLDPPDPTAMALVIGPEGGLTPDETGWLARQGFSGLRLGPRVLRTETAGPAAIAVLQSRFGDWQ